MALMPEDKRKFPRVSLRTPIRCQIRGEPRFESAVSDDISANGLSFTGEKFIAPTTPVMLEVKVLNKVVRPIGRIAWSQPLSHSDRLRSGIEFVELNPMEREYLKEFIKMHSSIITSGKG